jgi:hypothetical protein
MIRPAKCTAAAPPPLPPQIVILIGPRATLMNPLECTTTPVCPFRLSPNPLSSKLPHPPAYCHAFPPDRHTGCATPRPFCSVTVSGPLFRYLSCLLLVMNEEGHSGESAQVKEGNLGDCARVNRGHPGDGTRVNRGHPGDCTRVKRAHPGDCTRKQRAPR